MDDKTMSELIDKPLGELQTAMAGLEIPDAVADAALAEVLRGAAEEEGAGEEERAARAARAARTEARGKALEALRHAQLAVQLDQRKGSARAAIKHYERALDDFGRALEGGAIPESGLAKTLASMEAYLDRSCQLRLELDRPDSADGVVGSDRRRIFDAMARAGSPVLARGVKARKAALAAARAWPRFVYLSDAADCFVAYLKVNDPPPEAVTKVLAEVLADLEPLAANLRQSSSSS